MASSVRTRVGDLFTVPIRKRHRRYFQYIANDWTQLNGDVVRVFKSAYSSGAAPDPQEMVLDAVDFYAHVIVPLGIKMKLWQKVGNHPVHSKPGHLVSRQLGLRKSGRQSIATMAHLASQLRISLHRQPQEKHSKDFGIVVAPIDLIDRIRTEEYRFAYPAYR